MNIKQKIDKNITIRVSSQTLVNYIIVHAFFFGRSRNTFFKNFSSNKILYFSKIRWFESQCG